MNIRNKNATSKDKTENKMKSYIGFDEFNEKCDDAINSKPALYSSIYRRLVKAFKSDFYKKDKE